MRYRYLFRKPITSRSNHQFFGDSGKKDNFFSSEPVQAKLSIGQPGDKFEKEADAVADRVVSGQSATPVLSTAGGLNRKCAECDQEDKVQRAVQEEEEAIQSKEGEEEEVQMQAEEEEEAVQTKEEEEDVQMKGEEEEEAVQTKEGEEEEMQTKSSGPAAPGSSFTNRLHARSGSGSNLSGPVRAKMESSIGADFSSVRIHNDREANQMSSSIQAQAFTRGNDVYFNAGKYRPESTEGQRLLAHELTHVVQQGGGREKVQRNPNSTEEMHESLTRQYSEETGIPYRTGLQYSPGYASWLASKNQPAAVDSQAAKSPKYKPSVSGGVAVSGGVLAVSDGAYTIGAIKGDLKIPLGDWSSVMKSVFLKTSLFAKYKSLISDKKSKEKWELGGSAFLKLFDLAKSASGNFKLQTGPLLEGSVGRETKDGYSSFKGTMRIGAQFSLRYSGNLWELNGAVSTGVMQRFGTDSKPGAFASTSADFYLRGNVGSEEHRIMVGPFLQGSSLHSSGKNEGSVTAGLRITIP